ncbi:MAG: hypothetical protein AABW79_01800 [Nanoarchaeota archaeon]
MGSYQFEGYVAGDERIIDLGEFGRFSLGYIRGKLESGIESLEIDLRAIEKGNRVTREILDLKFVI